MSEEKIIGVDENGFAIEINVSDFEESVEKPLESSKETETVTNSNNVQVEDPVYVTAPPNLEDVTKHLSELRNKARLNLEKNKIKLNPHTKAHLDKHFKQYDGSCQSGINRTGGVYHDKDFMAKGIALDENRKNFQEAMQNISAITKILAKQLEATSLPPPPVKKTWKEKMWDRVAVIKTHAENKKRDIFFSVVKRAQKALNVKG